MVLNVRKDVEKLFADLVGSDEKLLEECTSICQIYNVDPENLLYKWEAMNFKPSSTRSEISLFTMDSIIALKAQIQRELAKESVKKPQTRITATSQAATVNRSRIPPNLFKNLNAGQKLGSVQPKIEQSYGIPSPSTSKSVIAFRGPEMDSSSRKRRSYRYMHEKILERSEALDDRIDEFSELIRGHYNISDLGDPSSLTDEDITVIGRITHDSDSSATMSKLTEVTMALESSRMLASGTRVSLRFDPSLKIRGGAQGVGGAGLFPGAIVALKGKNGGGGWFLVTEVLALPPLKPSNISLGLPRPKVDQGFYKEAFSMCIVSGPYTPDADLAYKPWRALLKNINISKPTAVLLIGPFVDVQHPKIKNGDIDTTPANLFHSNFIDPLRAFLDSSPGSIVLVVPSIRDLVSRQIVFPQGELTPELSEADPRIHLLPNPAKFSLNDITFAVSSVDVLYHLRKEEYLKQGAEVASTSLPHPDDTGADPMANACRHLLQQNSFYPLFPVPHDVSHEVNLTVTHLDGLKLGNDDDNTAPDILIVPSRLKHFSKTVYSTTALNPSFLTKGTYATLNVVEKDESCGLKERLTTEVVKLESSS